jgi:site-specific recombinase XerD
LPDDVGYALATYILEYRPVSEYKEVFLSAAFPIKPLTTTNGCLDSAIFMCGYTENIEAHGTHLLRRTGASNLLRQGISTDMITALLGQQHAESVEPYLSADEKGMLMCCGDFNVPGFAEVPL